MSWKWNPMDQCTSVQTEKIGPIFISGVLSTYLCIAFSMPQEHQIPEDTQGTIVQWDIQWVQNEYAMFITEKNGHG